ncbi:MAG: helicase DnaB, partial [Acutalibacteraceae bacterium]
MGYALQLGAWSSVFAVPGALVDQYIKAADGDQLKVILWLLRNNGRSYSAEEIAAAVGLSGSRAESAVQFWVQNGLLQREDAPLATSLLPAAAPAPAAAAPAQLVRPAPPRRMLRPDGVYISELVETSPSIRRLVEEAEAMLGKTLSPA